MLFASLVRAVALLPCNFYNNRMTISDYNAKPVRGDRAIILKLYGGQLLNCTVIGHSEAKS